MAKLNAANNAQSPLNGVITDVATSMSVLDGSIFPDAPFAVTVEDEIIYVVEKSGSTFSSILRAQEGTAAAAHAKGVSVENRMTAGMYNALATQEEVDNKLAQKQNNIGYTPENIANKGVANGYASLDTNTKIPLSQLPDTAKQQTYVVNSETERLALSSLIEGDKCFEVSTGDSYIWNGTEWLISAKADWENVNLQWGNIIDKPNSTVANIDDAVDKKHEHNNLTLLQNITQTLVDRWNTVTDKVDKVTGKGLSTEDYTTDEKNKLSGIATGANNYTHPTSHPASMITESSTKRFVSDSEKSTWNSKSDTDTVTTINGKTGAITKADIVALGIPAQDTTYNTVTTTTNGLMIATDKVKLNGIESGANKYTHPTTAGNKHIPTGGTVGQILKNTASGTATWADETDTITTINGKTGAITKADIVALGIPAQDTVYIHPDKHAISEVDGLQTALDGKVNTSQVLTNVPAGAVFTDTVTTINGKTGAISKADIVALGIPASDTNTTYAEITTAEIDAGTASTLRTITGRRVKYILDKVQGWIGGLTKSDVGLSNVDNVKQMPISNGVLENYREKLVTLSGTSTTINLSLGNVFTHTLSGNTTYTITNAVSGQAHSFTLIITQGGTVRTLTFPASVKWQGGEIPDMTTASKTYVLTFLTINGGTTWLGMFGGEF